jgi:hypothetical protein
MLVNACVREFSGTTNQRVACAVIDVTQLALVIAGFALALAYANLCDHLLAPPANKVASS